MTGPWEDYQQPTDAPVKITVRSASRDVDAEGYTSTPRKFTIADVQAAARGDMLNSPGMPVKYEAQPGQQFGVDATKNAQPFNSIVAHHTGSPTLAGALNTARAGDPFRSDVKYGYHFYIDTDGTVVQGAPLDARTNHVQPPGSPQRTDRQDVGNSSAIGISFVGKDSSGVTPQQLNAAQTLSRALMERYHIPAENVVGHGQIQASRQPAEGMPLVDAVHNGPPVAVAQPSPVQGPSVANAEPAPKSGPWAAFQKKAGPTISRGGALTEGLRSGLTFNFGDELAGVAGAAGTPKELESPLSGPSDFIIGLAKLGKEYLTGGDAAAKRYADSRDEVRAAQKAAEEQHPGTYLAGQLGGAIALPMGGVLNGATLPARMGRGAALGFVTGGLAGAGEGTTVEDRASRAAIGSAVGLAGGAIAPPLIEGGTKLVGAAVSKPVNMLRAAVNPDGAAARAVGRAYQTAERTDPNAVSRLDRSELTPGGPQMVMDVLGGEGRDLARSAGNLSGGARDILNQPLDARYETQSNRFVNWFNHTFNYPNAHAQQQAIDKVEKTVNTANYNKAFAQGRVGIWDQDLAEMSQAPVVQSAVKDAIAQAQNKSAGGVLGPSTPARWANNGKPTLEMWDLVKRQIDQDINVAKRAGRNEDVKTLTEVKNNIVSKLDAAVPAYQDARQGAAKFFGAETALEAGQKFVTENFNVPQTRAALAKMSSTERQLFQDGFVSRYIEQLNSVADRADITKRIYNTPAAKEKIGLVLGQQRATELEAMIRIENIMQSARRAVQGNSTTAAQIIGAGLASGAGGGYLGYDPTMSGIVGALATAGKKGVDARVAQRVAQMLISDDPAVLNRGIQMIASNKRLMGALRSADSAGARVGGNQGYTALPAMQSPSVGRAQDDKPVIPGPPGQ